MLTPNSPRKTIVDYAATAVCPALIMLLVGSVIFFLLAIGYAGSHLGELRWTFFWFVLAMVLVSRIAIEKGSEYAGVYGLCLALATAFMLAQYATVDLWLWALLGLIWWATNKLTWDCTLIEDDQDSSGEGLLQAAKLDTQEQGRDETRPAPAAQPARLDRKTPPPKPPRKPRWWDRILTKRAAGKKPHAPGRWVIYFSLGALPVFGLGQGFIPARDSGTRHYAFCLLVIYLASALGLLLITSFLGLRRYLRQRYLHMPPAMAATWLTAGVSLVVVILLGCLLLPRPNAYWSLTAMIDRLGDPVPKSVSRQTTSSPHSAEKGKGNAQPQANDAGQAKSDNDTTTAKRSGLPDPGERTAAARAAGPNAQESAPPGDTSRPARSETDGRKTGQADAAQTGQAAQGLNPPAPSARANPGLPLQELLKWLRLALYAALLGVILVAAIKYRDRLWWLLQELWRALLELWNGLFVRAEKPAPNKPVVPTAAPRRPFASLLNPFASGAATQMTPEQLVICSFQGLEAWAEEHRCGRNPDQTPFEFAERVALEVPDLAHEAEQVARLYVQVAYAQTAVLPACRTMLEILWSKMTVSMP